MLHVHTRGRGACGVYTREVAESKVSQVNEYARMSQHPLPVSYTHLDVYKRQSCSCTQIS